MKVVEVSHEPEDPELDDEAAGAAGAKKKKKKKSKKKAGDAPAEEQQQQEELEGNLTAAPENAAFAVADDTTPEAGEEAAADESTETAAKKKKKKKKGGGNAAEDAAAAVPTAKPAQPTEDAQARFQEALDTFRNAEPLPASDLSRCGIGDKKLRQLLAAWRGASASSTLTALDLSRNSISDDGAVALCNALAAEGDKLVPQLTSLSLAGNPLSAAAAAICAAALSARPAVALTLPEHARPDGTEGASATGSAPVLDDYFASRGTAGAEAAAGSGKKAGEEEERPTLVGPALSLDVATGILEAADPATAGSKVEVCDAIQSLTEQVEAECAQLAASATQHAKFLPAALKWCAHHVAVLGSLLAPPPRPRISYGDAHADVYGSAADSGWCARLGRYRLLLIELVIHLINARRPPLTSALADAKPSLVCVAVSLFERHPSSGVLGQALYRLVDVASQAKPLRANMLTAVHVPVPTPRSASSDGPATTLAGHVVPSLQATVAAGLKGTDAATTPRDMNLHPATSLWLELAGQLEKLGGSDKQSGERLASSKEWTALMAGLPELRHKRKPPAVWACGDPPVKEGARSIGAGSEMGELLRLLQSMPGK